MTFYPTLFQFRLFLWLIKIPVTLDLFCSSLWPGSSLALGGYLIKSPEVVDSLYAQHLKLSYCCHLRPMYKSQVTVTDHSDIMALLSVTGPFQILLESEIEDCHT